MVKESILVVLLLWLSAALLDGDRELFGYCYIPVALYAGYKLVSFIDEKYLRYFEEGQIP
jgi:hypothetical protein